MKWETKTRGRELPGMEALSFTVLVAHGGVGVAIAGCGGRRWFSFFSPLLRCAVFFLCFLFPCQRCSCLSVVASWRCCWCWRCSWWRRRGRLAVVRGGLCFSFSVFSSFSSCLLLVLLSLFSLYFSLRFSFFSLFSYVPLSVFFFLLFPHWFFSSFSPPCIF